MKKAEAFFHHEDYESTLEVYNYGLDRVCPDYAAMWNNRGAVQLKVGNYHQAIKDSSKALELLDPPVEANAIMRAKALIRRGNEL
jgi:tetratricopeptide (TPR) repeat protein